MNFQNGRKILTLLTFGCRSDNNTMFIVDVSRVYANSLP